MAAFDDVHGLQISIQIFWIVLLFTMMLLCPGRSLFVFHFLRAGCCSVSLFNTMSAVSFNAQVVSNHWNCSRKDPSLSLWCLERPLCCLTSYTNEKRLQNSTPALVLIGWVHKEMRIKNLGNRPRNLLNKLLFQFRTLDGQKLTTERLISWDCGNLKRQRFV